MIFSESGLEDVLLDRPRNGRTPKGGLYAGMAQVAVKMRHPLVINA
jgi:hypothetical protein